MSARRRAFCSKRCQRIIAEYRCYPFGRIFRDDPTGSDRGALLEIALSWRAERASRAARGLCLRGCGEPQAIAGGA